MSIKISVVLDWEEEDVIRHLLVPENLDLESLHTAIAQSFQLALGEMASFYRSDEAWEQGEEIPLMPFDPNQHSMKELKAGELLGQVGNRMLYVYDFLEMWTFFIETIEISAQETEGVKVVLMNGQRPKEAPPRPEAQDQNKGLFDDLDLDLGEFDDLDDYWSFSTSLLN